MRISFFTKNKGIKCDSYVSARITVRSLNRRFPPALLNVFWRIIYVAQDGSDLQEWLRDHCGVQPSMFELKWISPLILEYSSKWWIPPDERSCHLCWVHKLERSGKFAYKTLRMAIRKAALLSPFIFELNTSNYFGADDGGRIFAFLSANWKDSGDHSSAGIKALMLIVLGISQFDTFD